MTDRVLAGSRDLVAAALIFVTTIVVQLPFFDLWLAPMDEGHMALYAEIARTGGAFYRDATFYPLPGAFLLLSFLFELFGPSLWVSRVFVMLQFALFVALLYLMARRMTSVNAALVAVLGLVLYRVWTFPHWQMFSYSTTALLVLLISALMLLRFFDRQDARWLYGAGFAFGLGVFCKQDYGASALFASSIALVVFVRSTPAPARSSGLRLALGFLLPAAGVGALAGLWFLSQGTLGAALQFTVFNHFAGMASYEYTSLPPLFPLFRQDPVLRVPPGIGLYTPSILFTADAENFFGSSLFHDTAVVDTLIKIFFFGPYLLYGCGAVLLWRRRGRFAEERGRRAAMAELLLWALGTGLLILFTLNRPQDFLHLVVLYWPIPVLLAAYSAATLVGRPRAVRIAAALVLLAVVVPVSVYSAVLAHGLRSQRSARIDLPRAGVKVSPGDAAVLEEIVAYVTAHSAPDDPVAVMPYCPAIQFFADRRGPHPASYIVWPTAETPDRDQQIIEAMQRTQTELLIYDFTYFLDFPQVAEYAPDLFDYLVDHFRIERVFTRELVGMRMGAALRQSPRAGRAVVPRAVADLSIRRVGQDGQTKPSDDMLEAWVMEDRWPLRRVLAIRPASGGDSTVLSVAVTPRSGERLRSAVGVRPDAWASYRPSRVTFSIAARQGGERHVLFERTLDPHRKLEDRGWFELDIDLADFADAPVELEFATATDRPDGERFELGGFERPLLVPGNPESGAQS